MELTNPEFTFDAIILGTNPEGKGGAYINVPFNVKEVYGTKGRVPIQATFDGVFYRGSIANMGAGNHILIVRKDIRTQIKKGIGDTVLVALKKDTEPRIIETPAFMAKRLKEFPSAETFFEKLSYACRKEYIEWVSSAKRETTRERRLEKAISMLTEGKKFS